MSNRICALVILGLAASCKDHPPPAKQPAVRAALAPVECLRKVRADGNTDLRGDAGIQLCSGATDPDAPLECFDEARASNGADLNVYGALMLCSPFNLDAYNAWQRECPSVDTGSLDLRLRAIEEKLDDLARR